MSFVLSALRFLNQVDTAVYHFVNRTLTPPVLDPLMRVLSSDIPWWILGIGLLLANLRSRSWTVLTVTLQLVVAIGLTDGLSSVVKDAIGRRRPCHEYAHWRRGAESCGSYVGTPSNHAANAAAFVGVIATSPFARATPIAVFAAVLIAWSRVHLGVHYVGDVLLGALLGITIGTALGVYLPERVLRSAFGFLPRRSKP